jgi:hypothetical protein
MVVPGKTGPTVPVFHPTDGDVHVAGPVHSDCPYTSMIGKSRAAKKSKHSLEMGAAPVIITRASVSPSKFLTLLSTKQFAQEYPQGDEAVLKFGFPALLKPWRAVE